MKQLEGKTALAEGMFIRVHLWLNSTYDSCETVIPPCLSPLS